MRKSLLPILFIALLALISLSVQFVKWIEPQKPSTPELNQQLDSLQSYADHLQKQIDSFPSVITVSVQAGEGLFQVMQRAGLDNMAIISVINAIADSVELTKLKVGDRFDVATNSQNSQQITFFRYQENPSLAHVLIPNSKGKLQYHKHELPTQIIYRLHEGTLTAGGTLDGTLRAAAIPGQMVGVVNGVLRCKVSFRTHAQPGDRFRVLLKERIFQDSIWIEGHVLYAEYEGKTAGHHEAFRYEDPDPKSTFNAHYTASGEALVYAGLRYPLDRLHIVSNYGMRLHPVTGKRVMHAGVDYSSPVGAPVYAVAEGRVVVSGYDKYSGKKIAIKHKDKSSSWYLHLSKRSVKAGDYVHSRQVIGRVGATGRVTGPHLHFGFKKPNDKWMNPLSKRMIATPKLSGKRLNRLQQQVQEIQTLLQNTPVTH